MKTTRYFEEQVLRKRPYIERAWCIAVIAAPIRRETQSNGRIRFWRRVRRPGEPVHNAFDRGFKENQP
jgi:hypothetical protein